jgi:hypothetical protein
MGTPFDYNCKKVEGWSPAQHMYLVERGARAVQEEGGLTVDGLAGPITMRQVDKLVGGNCPIPGGSRDEVRRVYGDFSWSEGNKGRVTVDPLWVRANIVRVTLHTGKRVSCHRLVADEMVALYEAACKASEYTPTKIGMYVPRHTMWNPTKSLSTHSWGIAFDIDWHINPYGVKEGTRLRQDETSMNFVHVFEDAGWTWGGRWRTGDDMHFQRTGR